MTRAELQAAAAPPRPGGVFPIVRPGAPRTLEERAAVERRLDIAIARAWHKAAVLARQKTAHGFRAYAARLDP